MTDRPSSAPLVSFLRSCLDDDERVASAAASGPWAVHSNGEVYAPGFDREVRYSSGRSTTDHVFVTSDSEGLSPSVQPEDAEHIARWDPARVLAEVEAKRRILAIHAAGKAWPNLPEQCVRCSDVAMMWNGVEYPCETVRALALPYADRPGYDPAWKL